MTLEKLIKKGKAFAVGLALAATLVGGCNQPSGGESSGSGSGGSSSGESSGSGSGGSSSGGTPPVVTYPDTTISAPDFGNGLDGIVNYIVTGQNAKCPISRINLKVNGTAYDVPADPNVEILSVVVPDVPIIDGANDLIATAYSNCDGKEVADQTPAEYAFTPATEDEARAKIETLLQNAGYASGVDNQVSYSQKTFINDKILSVTDNSGTYSIPVDYWIVCPNLKEIGIIEYVNPNPDILSTKLSEKNILINNQRNPLYMSYLPADEVGARVDSYINTVMNLITCP